MRPLKKKRISGLYLDPQTVAEVEELRAKERPVPSLNLMIVKLLTWALEVLRKGWYGQRVK